MSANISKTNQSIRFSPALFSSLRGELFGFSIINVMIYHYASSFLTDCKNGVLAVPPYNISSILMHICHDFFCSVGVEIFLLLSGIGLFFSFCQSEKIGQFYKHRFLRILPEYLVVAFIYWWLCDTVFRDRGWINVLKDVFFVSFPSKGIVSLWYVIAILAFYVAYPFLYFLWKGCKKRTLLLIILLLVSMGILIFCDVHHVKAYWNMRIGVLRIPVMLIGIHLGPIVYKAVKEPKTDRPGWVMPAIWVFIIATFIGRILIQASPAGQIIWRTYDALFGLAMLTFVTLIIMKIPQTSKLRTFLRLCGTYSLELYLTHVCLRWIFESAGLHTGYPQIYLLVLAISVAITPLLHRFGKLFRPKSNYTAS